VRKVLKDVATFYLANAPLPYTPTAEVKEQLLAVFDGENLSKNNYQRQWWNASKDSDVYHHLDVSSVTLSSYSSQQDSLMEFCALANRVKLKMFLPYIFME
jgi:hypothetical protein